MAWRRPVGFKRLPFVIDLQDAVLPCFRDAQARFGVRVGDDPVLPVLQDTLCRAGQRDRADRPQGALRPIAASPGSRIRRRSTSRPPRRHPHSPPLPSRRRRRAGPSRRPPRRRSPRPMAAPPTPISGRGAIRRGCGRSSPPSAGLLMVGRGGRDRSVRPARRRPVDRDPGEQRQHAQHHRPGRATAARKRQ